MNLVKSLGFGNWPFCRFCWIASLGGNWLNSCLFRRVTSWTIRVSMCLEDTFNVVNLKYQDRRTLLVASFLNTSSYHSLPICDFLQILLKYLYIYSLDFDPVTSLLSSHTSVPLNTGISYKQVLLGQVLKGWGVDVGVVWWRKLVLQQGAWW